MVHPARVPGDHDVFVCGNDAGAKETVKTLLREVGWKRIVDLGDITAVSSRRGTSRFLETITHRRGRARRGMTSPVPGFTTTLLLPAPLPSD